jgi:hypothetical protein
MKRAIKKYGIKLPVAYAVGFLVLVGIMCRYSRQHIGDPGFNIATYLTPVITYMGIALAFLTIQNNKQSNKEKNALEFEKVMSEATMLTALSSINRLRKTMLQADGKSLDRKKMSVYMEGLLELKREDKDKLLTKGQVKRLENEIKNSDGDDKKRKISILSKNNEIKLKIEHTMAISTALNAMEACSNAIRYEIYDEELIYNIYGSQLIKLYEMCYTFIKRRQYTEERLFMNVEWLAVKWTLQRNISGEVSNKMRKTINTISHANEQLKKHRKAESPNELKPYLEQLEELRFPD